MKIISKIKRNIRLTVQLLFTALTNGYVTGFLEGSIFQGPTKMVCLPGLNCYSCPGSFGSCPIGSLQAVLTSRQYNFSFYLVGFFLLIGAVLGRLVCGFLCPFGLVQDLLNKIPFVKKIKKFPLEKYLEKVKYIILLVFVIVLPIGIANVAGVGTPWFCKVICPSGTLMGGIPLLLRNEGLRQAAGLLFTWKFGFLVGIIYISMKTYRPFCRFLCPLGAIYGFFNPIALYRYEVDQTACIDCGICEKTCPMNIASYKEPNSMECIRCGECIRSCPTDAISTSFKGKAAGKKSRA